MVEDEGTGAEFGEAAGGLVEDFIGGEVGDDDIEADGFGGVEADGMGEGGEVGEASADAERAAVEDEIRGGGAEIGGGGDS